MPVTHLLDTSVYCQPIRKRPVERVIRHWNRMGDASLCICSLCLAELLQGLESQDSPALWDRYHAILEDRLPVLDINASVAKAYGVLSGQFIRVGKPRPVIDLLIASTAKVNALIVATLNPKDFVGIPGVAVEDWSEAG